MNSYKNHEEKLLAVSHSQKTKTLKIILMKTRLLIIALFSTIVIYGQQTDVVTGLNFPTGIAISGNNLFIGDLLGRNILRIDITDTNPTTQDVITGLSQTRDMLITGNTMYLAGIGSDRIIQLDISQTNPADVTLISGLNDPRGLALDGNMLYISETSPGQERIIRVDITSGTPTAEEVILTPNIQVTDMQIVGNFLYTIQFFPASNDRIARLDITQSNPSFETIYEGSFNAQNLHIAGDLLYFTSEIDPNNSGREILQRIRISDTNPTPTTIASNLDEPNAILTVNDEVYISEFRGDKVVKIADNTLSVRNEILEEISIFPNPASDIIKVDGVEVKSLQIYDLNGRKVKNSLEGSISVRDLSRGVYLMRITDTQNRTANKKIIIQ